MKHIAFIGLGSNIGDGVNTLQRAWREIDSMAKISALVLSSPYLSEPVGMTSDNWFTNAVGALQTDLDPTELLESLQIVETDFGRRRDAALPGYQDRTLDLDILYFDDYVRKSASLTLPHPCLAERLFVLEPLADVAGDFKDPVDGMTAAHKLAQLQQRMRDDSVAPQQIHKAGWL
ncbi:MAG: 2-amino-4-hydroxy-6-hydroxymethyldihydropteridine diphosphokinase [Desulfopila sp.]